MAEGTGDAAQAGGAQAGAAAAGAPTNNGASTTPAAAGAPAASSTSVALPADVLASVEREQALADLEASLKSREEEVERLKQEKLAVVSERDAAVSTANQLRSQLGTLQSTLLQSTSELSVTQSRAEASKRQKAALLEEIQHAHDKATQASKAENQWRQKAAEWSQKSARLEVEVSELKMAANSSKFNEERSVQALNNAREENKNLIKAATDAEARFSRYRASRESEISELQQENETLNTSLTSVQSKHAALLRTFDEQSRRLGDAHANIANLTANAASQKMSYRLEFDRLMEEIRLLGKRGDEARAAVADREAELERHAEEMAEREHVWEERLERSEKALKVAQKQADDFKTTLQQITASAADGSLEVSPAASLASSQRASGKSYTQFYTDYVLREQQLQEKDKEIERLSALVEEINQDIQEHRPILNRMREDHNEAIQRANELAAEVATAIAAREKFETRVKSLEAAAAHHADEVSSLESQLLDRDTQVKSLVRELAIRDDPSLAYVAFDNNAQLREGDPISDRLLLFKSLPALQEQNGKLLKIVRALQAKLADRETRRATEEDDGALDQAAETITTLHAKLVDRQNVITELQGKIIEVTRERDVFSRLLSRGEGLHWPNGAGSTNGPLEESHDGSADVITRLQAEIDIVRKKAEEDVAEANKTARDKSAEAATSELERAKAEAKATMVTEQQRLLTDSLEHQKNENSALEAQVRQLRSQIEIVQQERRKALEEVATNQATAARLRDEGAQLRLEKEQWESVQFRMQSDFATVQQERANLQHLIDNLKGISVESGRTRAEEVSRLEKRIEELQRDAVALRAQADQAREATRAAEVKVGEADVRIANETAAIRTELDAAKALVASKDAEIATLTAAVTAKDAEIAALEQSVTENKGRGLKWQRRAGDLTQEKAETAAAHQRAIAEKEAEVADLKTQLEEAGKKVAEAEGKIAEAEKKATDAERRATTAEQGAAAKDASIQKLQTELSQAKSQAQAQAPAQVPVPGAPESAAPAPDTAQLTAVTAERDALKDRLAQAEKELETVKAAAATAAAPAPAAAAPASTDTAAAPAADSGLQAKVDELTQKLSDKEAQYEKDVMKVNRSNVGLNNKVKALSAEKATLEARVTELEAEAVKLKAEVAELNTKLATGGEAGSGGGEEAVKAAVAKRETELKKEHAVALAAKDKTTTELRATYDKKLADAEAKAKTATAAPAEGGAQDAKVAELQEAVKTLERQVRTAEIARKTLLRQKNDAEAKLKNLEGGTAATPSAATPSASTSTTPAATPAAVTATPAASAATPATASPATPLSATATAFKPTAGAKLPAKPAVAVNTGTPATTAEASEATPTTPSTRGGIRGRGRGASIRGRGAAPGRAGVLNAVNATLSETATTTTTTSAKRPAPEEAPTPAAGASDILARLQSNAAATDGPATRAAKRARGSARGRGTGRRASGAEGGEE